MNWRFAVWNLVAIAIGGASGYSVGVATRSPLQGIISGIVFGGLAWLAYRWFPNAQRATVESSTSPTESTAVADDLAEVARSARDDAETPTPLGQIADAQRRAGGR